MEAAEALQTEELRASNGVVTEAELIELESYRKSRGSEGPGYSLVHGSVSVPGTDEPVRYTVGLPDDPQDPHFHMFVPGFGGFKRTSRKIRTTLSQAEEIATISYEPARNGGIVNDLISPQQVHIDTINAIAQDLPRNPRLQELPASHDIDYSQLVLLPHSMGGLPAIEHSLKHTADVSRLIMIATVGNEPPVKLGFVPRLGFSLINEIAPAAIKSDLSDVKDGLAMLTRTVKYYGSNPIRTTGEIASCMLADKRERLKKLGALGVKTALYLPEHDKLIPANVSMEASGALVDYIEIAAGINHLAPQTRYDRVGADIARISRHLASL
jgi:pimeloyl-ACP methyl ester carboxylesterase